MNNSPGNNANGSSGRGQELLIERSDRGIPRGADTVLTQARASLDAGPAKALVMDEPSATNTAPTFRALLAAACVAFVLLAGVAVRAMSIGDGAEIDTQPAGDVDTAEEADNRQPVTTVVAPVERGDVGGQPSVEAAEATVFTVPDGHHVPLLVVDDPTFRVTGGHESTMAGEQVEWSRMPELSAYHDPDLGFDGPVIAISPYAPDWESTLGESVVVGGVEMVTDTWGPTSVVFLEVGGTQFLVSGINMAAEDLQNAAVGIGPDGLLAEPPPSMKPLAVQISPELYDVAIFSEYNFELGGNWGDILVAKGSQYQFLHSVLGEWLDESTSEVRTGTVLGHDAILSRRSNRTVARWHANGFVFEFRFEGDDLDELEDILPQLVVADVDKWTAATPADWVGVDGLRAEVNAVVDAIRLPDGLTMDDLVSDAAAGPANGIALTAARRVACVWIGQWVDAQAVGDQQLSDDAAAGLTEVSDMMASDYPGLMGDTFTQYAEAVETGSTVTGGRELTVQESYRDALGCHWD